MSCRDDTPLFDQLQHETLGQVVPDHRRDDEPQEPATTMLPATGYARRVSYGGYTDWAATTTFVHDDGSEYQRAHASEFPEVPL